MRKQRRSMRAQRGRFSTLAKTIARVAGHGASFMLALALILAWIITGPLFGFSDTWQLVINTSTTIVTFLMVFLIQNTQNRDAEAVQIKLDEMIRSQRGAHNALLDLEELSDEELDEIRQTYEALAVKARNGLQRGRRDTGSPEVTRAAVHKRATVTASRHRTGSETN